MKVLIIKLGALGDVVMATPLVEAISKTHPDARIDLITSPGFESILNQWSNVTVYGFERRGWATMARVIKFVRAGRYDRIYDLQSNDRTSVLCALSGAKERIGNHPRFPYTHAPADKWAGQSHIFERMKNVLASAGISDIAAVPILNASRIQQQKVSDWLAESKLQESKFCLIHAGASPKRPEKCWPHFAELAKRVIDANITPVWIGAGADRQRNEKLCAEVGGVDASDGFDIFELAVLGRFAKFALTNDSGPMHILAAAEIPVFSLFGPSNWHRNHALKQQKNVITSPKQDNSLASISVDLVWQRISDTAL